MQHPSHGCASTWPRDIRPGRNLRCWSRLELESLPPPPPPPRAGPARGIDRPARGCLELARARGTGSRHSGSRARGTAARAGTSSRHSGSRHGRPSYLEPPSPRLPRARALGGLPNASSRHLGESPARVPSSWALHAQETLEEAKAKTKANGGKMKRRALGKASSRKIPVTIWLSYLQENQPQV
ncbi:hypothetical protein Salat_0850100 [Sesamum alatum]|uniref:Uncharacterized protein n=1 Tax=Sesamum alatum TaxID=300844 RepID=A0AAE1YIS0_9LAMI|nr:hypothetical protein Salat_0850100 [Sesamum alatum]